MENEPFNIKGYINCYKEPKGYYLDNKDFLYKKCFDTCETCEVKGNNITHNCLKCNHNYPFEVKNNNYSNCYKNCEHYYYFDKNNFYYCTNNLSCPIDFPTLIKDRRECINNNNYKSTDILIQIYSTLIKETIDNSDDAFPTSNLIEPKLEDNNDIKTKI